MAREAGEQRGHVPAAGADLEDSIGRFQHQLLHHARFHFWLQHGLTMADRYLHIGESERAVLRGDELFALYRPQEVEHPLVEHFPRPNLLLDHIEARAVDIHSHGVVENPDKGRATKSEGKLPDITDRMAYLDTVSYERNGV